MPESQHRNVTNKLRCIHNDELKKETTLIVKVSHICVLIHYKFKRTSHITEGMFFSIFNICRNIYLRLTIY